MCVHIHILILCQIIFLHRLLQSIESISLCYTVGPCYLPILHVVVCICLSPFPNLSLSPATFSTGNNKFRFKIFESVSAL